MGRWLTALAGVLSRAFACAPSALAAPGDLDSSFGDGGRATLTPAGREAVYSDVAIQPDGKIVLAGYTYSSTGRHRHRGDPAQLERDARPGIWVRRDAAINTDFAGRRNDLGNAVTLQPDGKIVVAGETDIPTGESGTIARVLPNGALDTAFATGGDDGDGVTWSALGAATDVAIDGSGKIVASGYRRIADVGLNRSDSFVERLNANGSPDTSFGVAGSMYPWVLYVDLGRDDSLARLVVLPDGG